MPLPIAEFYGTDPHIFFEFFVEIIHVLISHLFRDFIHFQVVFQKQLF